MLKRKKSEGSVLLSPRTVENILTLANDNNRNGTRVSMRDIKKEKQGVTPKISDMRVNGSELTKADRHTLPFYRHSLTGATPDCYAGRERSINVKVGIKLRLRKVYFRPVQCQTQKQRLRRNIVGLKISTRVNTT